VCSYILGSCVLVYGASYEYKVVACVHGVHTCASERREVLRSTDNQMLFHHPISGCFLHCYFAAMDLSSDGDGERFAVQLDGSDM